MAESINYNVMEAVLQKINTYYISLNQDEIKRNNRILKGLLNSLINLLNEDPLFEKLYNRIYYGGSYYDDLKVGEPEEYDLDILLKIPKILDPELVYNKVEPGYVEIQQKSPEKLDMDPSLRDLRKFLVENNKIDNSKVRSWLEGLLGRIVNSGFTLTLADFPGGTFKVKFSKSGPAHTLKLEGHYKGERIKIDIDLVPSFLFESRFWPEKTLGYKPNPYPLTKPEFFVVPKGPGPEAVTYWRLSFQDQEKELLSGDRVKPTIRLMKKFRDFQGQTSIASYWIKTVFMLELEKNPTEWNSALSLSNTFMKALRAYGNYLQEGRIPFYWNRSNNLLIKVSLVTCTDYANRVKRVISEIDRNVKDDPYIVAKFFMTPEEVERLREYHYRGRENITPNATRYQPTEFVQTRYGDMASSAPSTSSTVEDQGWGATLFSLGVAATAGLIAYRYMNNNNNNN